MAVFLLPLGQFPLAYSMQHEPSRVPAANLAVAGRLSSSLYSACDSVSVTSFLIERITADSVALQSRS